MSITTRIPDVQSDFKTDLTQAKIGNTFTLFKPENRLKLKEKKDQLYSYQQELFKQFKPHFASFMKELKKS